MNNDPAYHKCRKRRYNTCVDRDDRASQLLHITVQPVKQILQTVDNNILQNLPILQEGVVIAGDIY